MPLGTLVNVATVILGSLLGIMLQRSFPERLREIVFQAIGLFTMVYGVHMTLKLDGEAKHLLALVGSLLVGALIGEALRLEQRLEWLGERIKSRVKAAGEKFSEGMIYAFLIFCIGPMTVVGALEEGIRGDHTLLFTKALLDGFMSIVLASTYGIGVLFSIVPLFLFQYGITLLGAGAQGVFTDVVINQLTAVGGVLILGLGINLLGLAKLRVTNLLPALVVIVALTLLLG
ncbi:DUF554 domain-containing protein [bacterium]|nr:DUF554 domain-containing protein [bacterium]